MAKTASSSSGSYTKVKKSRPGVHSKTRASKLKKSKNYKKAYRAQGR
jgi:hypothetical protein